MTTVIPEAPTGVPMYRIERVTAATVGAVGTEDPVPTNVVVSVGGHHVGATGVAPSALREPSSATQRPAADCRRQGPVTVQRPLVLQGSLEGTAADSEQHGLAILTQYTDALVLKVFDAGAKRKVGHVVRWRRRREVRA